MGSIIFWTDEKIQEQENLIQENIKKAKEVATKEEEDRFIKKMSSSEPAIVIDGQNQNRVLVDNT